MPGRTFDLTVRESKPGGPWGFKSTVPVRVREDTLVWDVKVAILAKREGYEPAGARLYYLGVPMANCRSLQDYHVVDLATLHIMRGAQGCVEAGKSCICATQLQHVLTQNKRALDAERQAEVAEQQLQLETLVSASTLQSSLNRVLFLQVETVVLLVSSRSVHNAAAASAAFKTADAMVKAGADPATPADRNTGETPQELLKRLMGILYPRFRKLPPLLLQLADVLGVKIPRRREDE